MMLVKQGDLDSALEVMNEVYEIVPNFPSVNMQMGVSLWRACQHQKAMVFFEKWLRLYIFEKISGLMQFDISFPNIADL